MAPKILYMKVVKVLKNSSSSGTFKNFIEIYMNQSFPPFLFMKAYFTLVTLLFRHEKWF